MKYLIILIILLCCFIYSCGDSINQPKETALLDILISTNDSVKVEYDNTTLVKRKLTYTGILGFSWHTRMEQAEIGVHKITFTDFDDSSKAYFRFYVEDTLSVYVSNMQNNKDIIFSTINHEFYGE